MRVEHRLPGAGPGVEHQTITIAVDTLRDRDAMRLAHYLGEQPILSPGQCGGIRVVFLGDDQHMDGRLRVDIAERHRAGALHKPLSWEFASGNLAKQAVRHLVIVSVAPTHRELPGTCVS